MTYDHLADIFAKAFVDTGGDIVKALRLVDQYRSQRLAQRRQDLPVHLIVAAAARRFGVAANRIYRRDNHRDACDARWAVARALHNLGWPSVQIGHVLGGRDHSTILHALGCVQDRPELVAAADEILRQASEAKSGSTDGREATA
jgi:chromosomal replication initiation ATPase DnaA